MESMNISCLDSGRLLSRIDPNGKVTAFDYNDDLGELLEPNMEEYLSGQSETSVIKLVPALAAVN